MQLLARLGSGEGIQDCQIIKKKIKYLEISIFFFLPFFFVSLFVFLVMLKSE